MERAVFATSGEDITAVRILTFPKVRTPMLGGGIGSTRAFKFRRNIMYIESPNCKITTIIFPPRLARVAREGLPMRYA